MNAVQDMYQQALLAEAAYAKFDIHAVPAVALTTDGSSFSPTQAIEFLNQWEVVDHIPDTTWGFSATIFESVTNPGKYSLAIRGTAPFSVDVLEDAALIFSQGVAINQLVDLYNYWQRAQTASGSYTEEKPGQRAIFSNIDVEHYPMNHFQMNNTKDKHAA